AARHARQPQRPRARGHADGTAPAADDHRRRRQLGRNPMSLELPHVTGHEHPDVAGGWLRPAVFGAMDGLVSNVALIAGVAAGASTAGADQSQSVLLAGFAGLSAGALSMA